MKTQSVRDRVYGDLKARIGDGAFPLGESLPSLRDLSQCYETSVGTIRQALERLQLEGTIEARHGKGNFVAGDAQTATTVMLIAELSGDLFQDFVNGFGAAFNVRADYHLLFEKISPGRNSESTRLLRERIERLIREGSLAAIVFDGTEFFDTDFLVEYQDQVELLCFYNDAKLSQFVCPAVVSDWFHGGYAGLRHLADAGCRRPLVITHRRDRYAPQNVVNAYLEGCRQGAADAGLELLHLQHQAESDDYPLAFYELMQAQPEVDGIYAFADFRMRPLLPVLRRLGRVVGEDIATLGYYDTAWARAFEPAMSSVSVRPEAIVAGVCDHLFKRGEGRSHVRIPPQIVVRESSKLTR